jgi:hypothetical protein
MLRQGSYTLLGDGTALNLVVILHIYFESWLLFLVSSIFHIKFVSQSHDFLIMVMLGGERW